MGGEQAWPSSFGLDVDTVARGRTELLRAKCCADGCVKPGPGDRQWKKNARNLTGCACCCRRTPPAIPWAAGALDRQTLARISRELKPVGLADLSQHRRAVSGELDYALHANRKSLCQTAILPRSQFRYSPLTGSSSARVAIRLAAWTPRKRIGRPLQKQRPLWSRTPILVQT